MAGNPNPAPTVLTNRGLAVRQMVGFALLAVILAVVAVAPLIGVARRLTGVGHGLVLAASIIVLVVMVACLAGIVASWRLNATVGPDGIRARNLFGSASVAWSELAGVEIGASTSAQVTWQVATVIRSDGDRTFRVAVTYGRDTVAAQAFADAVRAWAPAGTSIGGMEELARAMPPPVAHSPIQSGPGRYVVRSWGSARGSGVVTILLTFWAVLGLLIAVVLFVVGGAVVAVVWFVLGAGVAWWFLRWTRPLLVVTPAGLLTRNGFLRRRVAWTEVTGVVAVQHLNRRGTRRRVVLTTVGDLDAPDGVQARMLWATDRPIGSAQPVHDQVMAFAPPTLLGAGQHISPQ
jgi:Bacterial PH domain